MPFADVIGHRAQIDFLRRVAAGGRLAHSLLLAGPPGIGKRRVADAFAAMLLCEEKGEDACGHCDSCRQFAAGSHPDLIVVTLPKDKREIPIEKARELNQFLRLQPLRGGRKIAIVDDAHLMNLAAQNALLKGLEEPPPGSLAILVAHNADALLPTIRSRCQRLLFAALPEAEVAEVLEQRAGLPQAEARTLAQHADGSPGRALRQRNTIVEGAGPRLADLSIARYGALVQFAAALAETEERASVGLEALLRSCHDEAVEEARRGDLERASSATEAASVVVDALANLRRRSANRQLLLESTFVRIAKRYAHGRGA
jgi:DNA polymerase III delta' subunit